MTTGHAEDTLGDAWALEPTDLVRGFLRMPVTAASGSHHTYDNSSTFVLARMVERVTGTPLPTLLDERLFAPLGITDIEWDRVGDGAVYGFHGLHLTTESVAAFGELMLRGGAWQGRPILSRTGWRKPPGSRLTAATTPPALRVWTSMPDTGIRSGHRPMASTATAPLGSSASWSPTRSSWSC